MKLKKFFYKKINSTNDIAVKKIKKGFSRGIVFAEEQTKSRGQYGKKWISLKGNLFLSVFIEVNKQISLKKITYLNCQIIKKILSKLFKIKLSIKLPNDLLINKKKVCGILQETITINDKNFIIIGIGINLIKNPIIKNYQTTNLLEETGIKITRFKLLNVIKKSFEKNLNNFH
jgi:BirA family biotin operon repressor/biotin-[acetyl-CoA-carboxylase] ligase